MIDHLFRHVSFKATEFTKFIALIDCFKFIINSHYFPNSTNEHALNFTIQEPLDYFKYYSINFFVREILLIFS